MLNKLGLCSLLANFALVNDSTGYYGWRYM